MKVRNRYPQKKKNSNTITGSKAENNHEKSHESRWYIFIIWFKEKFWISDNFLGIRFIYES